MSDKLPFWGRLFGGSDKVTNGGVEKAGPGTGEGSNRGPFWGMGELGNLFRLGSKEDGWQRNLRLPWKRVDKVPIVYACVMAQSRAVSSCYAQHRVIDSAGKHVIRTDTAVAKLLRNPNGYETWPQFILNVCAAMLFQGEAGVIIQTDNLGVPLALHRLNKDDWQPYVEQETGAIFYGVSKSGNPCIPGDVAYAVPARQFIHFRQHTPRHPLIGESPVAAAMLSIGVNVALSESQHQFFKQMRRPSGILTTDIVLTSAQIKQLRTAFDEQSKDIDQGGIPILGGGLKFSQMGISSQDSEVIATQRMTNEDVCRVYGVPPPVVADLTHATLNNAETLINHWLAIGLGSLLENIERSLDRAFDLPLGEYIELDTAALLRTDFMNRVNAYVKGIQGGLYTHNEAREEEGLPPVEHGDQPYVQQQMVPLSYAASNTKPPTAAPAAAPPAANDDDKDPDAEDDAATTDDDKAFRPEVAKALIFERIAKGKAQA